MQCVQRIRRWKIDGQICIGLMENKKEHNYIISSRLCLWIHFDFEIYLHIFLSEILRNLSRKPAFLLKIYKNLGEKVKIAI